ncbi:MAG: peptide chain release factor N(5)-glutamine methyltransferase [Rhodospirillaceae bacterium]|nr:peptide chain release factor N(5)-glutamine methyltransferase [Rhodospirillaceae bacterium]
MSGQGVNIITISQALRDGARALELAGIENPRIEARMLIAFAISTKAKKAGPETVLAESSREMTSREIEIFNSSLRRRCNHEPMAYILGSREFWSLPFRVTPATLIPRPDSETLIEGVLKHIDNKSEEIRILDLGTGSGCLLLALLSEFGNARGIGVDVSNDALEVAKLNANDLGLSARAEFINGDWNNLEFTKLLGGKFDLVISNPPYISNAELKQLDITVSAHEPIIALGGGIDGLDSYRAIVGILHHLVNSGAMVAFEVGFSQGTAVASLLSQSSMEVIEIMEDLSGIGRAVLARKIKP